jgi:hypothetical protein
MDRNVLGFDCLSIPKRAVDGEFNDQVDAKTGSNEGEAKGS